jgi:Fur family ferric uptake transcriptional regulator
MSPFDTIISKLRNLGYRITPQRERIIEVITHNQSHITAEDVFSELRNYPQPINLATVYRTLDMLWEEGFTCRNDLSEGQIVYATSQHGRHIHLVCRHCNRVIDGDPIDLKEVNEILIAKYGFDADLNHLSIFGVCSECSKLNYIEKG